VFDEFQRMQKDAFELIAEQDFVERERRAIANALKDKSVTQHRTYIEEQLLTLRCPVDGCRELFVGDTLDFTHCLALKCTRDHNFCGWCLQACGTSEAGVAQKYVSLRPLLWGFTNTVCSTSSRRQVPVERTTR
jgi:hypothetical protein